jgi:hypothetical protein
LLEHNATGVCGMTRSVKLGIASTLLLGSIFVPPFSNWREPISFASAGVSGVLGLLAAQQGSKWWLAIPSAIVAGFVIGLYFGAHSF